MPDGCMFIEEQENGSFTVFPPENNFTGISNISREHEVLTKMAAFTPDGNSWMNVYQDADFIKGSGCREDLICLSHLGRRVFNDFRGRAILADEVGLGKTIEASMAMTEYIMSGLVRNVLILTPASLVDQWYMEMKTLDFIRSDDPAFKKDGHEAWIKHKKIIASISAAKRKGVSDHIIATTYDMVIVDEAHHLKNRKSVDW